MNKHQIAAEACDKLRLLKPEEFAIVLAAIEQAIAQDRKLSREIEHPEEIAGIKVRWLPEASAARDTESEWKWDARTQDWLKANRATASGKCKHEQWTTTDSHCPQCGIDERHIK